MIVFFLIHDLFICCVAPAHAGVKYFGDCPVVNLLCVITLCHPLVFLLLLALLFLWVVHADSELAGLCAILVLHHKGVFARVSRGDGGDCDTGELVVLELEFVVVVRYQLLFVLRPGHLRYRLAPNVASQVQGLTSKYKLAGDWWVSHICNKRAHQILEVRHTHRITQTKREQKE